MMNGKEGQLRVVQKFNLPQNMMDLSQIYNFSEFKIVHKLIAIMSCSSTLINFSFYSLIKSNVNI